MRRTFVENHGDVRTKRALDFHGLPRSQKERTAIYVRTKLDAVGCDFANLRQTENLKPAAIRQHGVGPTDEFVESASLANDVYAWSNIEMIGIAENDLGAHLAKFARVEGLYAALSSHGHEHRRVHRSA